MVGNEQNLICGKNETIAIAIGINSAIGKTWSATRERQCADCRNTRLVRIVGVNSYGRRGHCIQYL